MFCRDFTYLTLVTFFFYLLQKTDYKKYMFRENKFILENLVESHGPHIKPE